MTEEIKNNIDELDGMVKIKGKCGYEIIGGCRELRELKQENKELKVTMYRLESKVDSMCNCNEELNTDVKIFRSALEEINLILDELKQQYDYMTDYSEIKEIQDKINEVLDE